MVPLKKKSPIKPNTTLHCSFRKMVVEQKQNRIKRTTNYLITQRFHRDRSSRAHVSALLNVKIDRINDPIGMVDRYPVKATAEQLTALMRTFNGRLHKLTSESEASSEEEAEQEAVTPTQSSSGRKSFAKRSQPNQSVIEQSTIKSNLIVLCDTKLWP
ncbi:hypothetical protein FQA39_LY04567 [Lamprigera yunnana]|nr:hypothetical protein FQA39_LY04567 [Lamprigera yunnana]